MNDTAHNQTESLVVLVAIVLMPVLLWLFVRRLRQTKGFPLRPIRAYQTLQGLLGRAAESGKRVHLSLGRAGIGGDQTAAVSAALAVLRHVADQGAAFGFSPIVTVADPTLMIVAQDTLHRAHRRAGMEAGYRPTTVQMIAQDAAAYAIGAQMAVDQDLIAANVMIGPLGDEYLLVGEAGARREIVQLVGSNDVSVQPLMLATSDRVLLGEEMFAAGAYLSRRPEQIASIQVQDALRLLVVVAIAIGVLLKTLA